MKINKIDGQKVMVLNNNLSKNIAILMERDQITESELARALRSGSKNSDQNLKELRYNSRQNEWRRDERTTKKIHAC